MTESRNSSVIASAPSADHDGMGEGAETSDLGESWFESAALWVGATLVRRGRSRGPVPKVPINIRLSAEVLLRFKATGRGWQTRINAALEQWLEAHPEVG